MWAWAWAPEGRRTGDLLTSDWWETDLLNGEWETFEGGEGTGDLGRKARGTLGWSMRDLGLAPECRSGLASGSRLELAWS